VNLFSSKKKLRIGEHNIGMFKSKTCQLIATVQYIQMSRVVLLHRMSSDPTQVKSHPFLPTSGYDHVSSNFVGRTDASEITPVIVMDNTSQADLEKRLAFYEEELPCSFEYIAQ